MASSLKTMKATYEKMRELVEQQPEGKRSRESFEKAYRELSAELLRVGLGLGLGVVEPRSRKK